jgi:D-3-phosphoglycerate dehydrogenase
MPVTDQTRGMLNAEAFARMKPGVRIVNAARGEIIEEKDLIAALESKKVAGAALDVFAEEPLPADHPFRRLPNLLLTPHLGASTKEAQEKCGLEVAEIIAAYLLTGEVRNAVNLPFIDAKTYEQVQPYLVLGEKLGKLSTSPTAAPRKACPTSTRSLAPSCWDCCTPARSRMSTASTCATLPPRQGSPWRKNAATNR